MINIKSKRNKWILWGNWNNCVLFGSIFLNWINSTIFKELELSKKDVRGDIKLLKGHFYVLKSDLDILEKLAVDSIEQDNSYLKKVFTICERQKKKLLTLENKHNLKEFIINMADFGGLTNVIELTSMVLDSYFKSVCEKNRKSFYDFSSIVKPIRETPLIAYFNELRSNDNLAEILKKFEWIGTHGFEGEKLNKKKIIQDKKIFKKEQLEAKEIPKEFKSIYNIACKLIFQRSSIMETFNKVAFSYRKDLINLGKKHNLSYNNVLSLTFYEILDMINKSIVPKNLKLRNKNFGLIQINNSFYILFNEKLNKEFAKHSIEVNNTQQINGAIAFPGIVRGIVRIVRDYRDIRNVKKGNIIVASETTVDYVSAMSKAAAFVTDQGGITSHASVISREMKKPCIVGTKIATRVLKDGDIVEVDAVNGVIRILK